MPALKRTAVVTGASSGFGRAICESLLEKGHRVIGIGRDFSKFECTNAHFHPVTIDLAQLNTLPEQLKIIAKKFANIDTLICNAGRGHFGSLEEFSFVQIKSLIDINFVSHTFVARVFLPLMKTQKFGNLIFIGSEAALQGRRKGAIYCATKFAIRGFAQALREECATSQVSVSLINPGMSKTGFFEDLTFTHGNEIDEYIDPKDVAASVMTILEMRPGTVIDEINLSPLKKVIKHKSST